MYEPYSYGWMFSPPPYGFTGPCRQGGPAPGWNVDTSGLGDCACGCGGKCGKGIGQITIGGVTLFSSGLDLSGWGIGEWAVVGAGAYLLASMIGDTKAGAKKAKRTYRRLTS